jgi:ribonuclease HII
MIVGIDEVGRGCLAGPVCVAAVALADELVDAIDSKQLTTAKRLMLCRSIKRQAILIGIGWAPHQYIDSHGLTAALKKAARQALEPFGDKPELILLDGNSNYINDDRVVTMVDGDAKLPLISAASIVAKVARDNYMQAMSRRFPLYGFERHVGYGTAVHRAAIASVGPCAIHRMSFAPLKGFVRVN